MYWAKLELCTNILLIFSNNTPTYFDFDISVIYYGSFGKKNAFFKVILPNMTRWKLSWKIYLVFCKNKIDFNLVFCKDKIHGTCLYKRQDWCWSENLARPFWKYHHIDLVFDKNKIQNFSWILSFLKTRLFKILNLKTLFI